MNPARSASHPMSRHAASAGSLPPRGKSFEIRLLSRMIWASRWPSDAAETRPHMAEGRADRPADRSNHETRHSSRLSRTDGALRLRPCVQDPLDLQRQHDAGGNLLELPPV